MRITGGKLRNRQVPIQTRNSIRPTSAKVREAIFSMIGQNLSGMSFLDSFGGSGIMALEAFSRGASPVTLTERSGGICRELKRLMVDLRAEVQVVHGDARLGFRSGQWDIIFLDPPYKTDVGIFLPAALSAAQQFVIVEAELNRSVVQNESDWSVWKHKVYGSTQVTIFKR